MWAHCGDDPAEEDGGPGASSCWCGTSSLPLTTAQLLTLVASKAQLLTLVASEVAVSSPLVMRI